MSMDQGEMGTPCPHQGKGGQSEKPARTHRTVNGRENDSFSRLSLFSSVFICVHLWLQLHCYGSGHLNDEGGEIVAA